jgi:adenosylhomocysteine nucleosidase
MPEIAMVAALERELRALVKHWQAADREYSGRRFRFWEGRHSVAVCGGIGAEAARRATEAVLILYQPKVVYSVGFAGALDPDLCVGDVIEPRYVIDAADGSRIDTGQGSGALVSFLSVAGDEQKAKLAAAYGARAVDMEAAAVARGAQARGVQFRAIKVISDELGFSMPGMDQFIDKNGRFRAAQFSAHVALRPRLWRPTVRLARNTAKAGRALCEYLRSAPQSSTSGALTHPAICGKEESAGSL